MPQSSAVLLLSILVPVMVILVALVLAVLICLKLPTPVC